MNVSEPIVSTAVADRSTTDTLGVETMVPQSQVHQSYENQMRELSTQELIAGASVWMAVAAMLTFIVTTLGTVAIWRQMKLTREAVKETSEATIAIREANAIATKSSENSLRAWVCMDTLKYERWQDGALDWWDFCVVVKNCGHSPASNVIIKTAWQVTVVPGETIDHFVQEWPEGVGTGVIAPGAIALSEHIQLTEEQITNHWVSIICKVEYADAITGASRETSFRIVAKSISGPNGTFAVRWSPVGRVDVT